MSLTLNESHDFTIRVWNRLCEECAGDDDGRRVVVRPERRIDTGLLIMRHIRHALLDADTHCFTTRRADESPRYIWSITITFKDAFNRALEQYSKKGEGRDFSSEFITAQANVVRHAIDAERAAIEAEIGPDI